VNGVDNAAFAQENEVQARKPRRKAKKQQEENIQEK